MIPTIENLCSQGTGDDQPILQLFDDKTFKIVDGAKATDVFDLGDFAFPTDGFSCISLDVNLAGGELTLFDNGLAPIVPVVPDLDADTNYARGIMLKVSYPTEDINDDTIELSDKNVILSIETVESTVFVDVPVYNLYIHFANPRSIDPLDLINRIKITNPNTLFKVDVTGLIIYGKTPE